MTRFSHSLLRNLPVEKALETHSVDLNVDILLFHIIKKILDKVVSYYNELQIHMSKFKPFDHDTLENIFSTKNYSRYYLWFLHKQQFEIFKKKNREFFEEIRKEFQVLKRQKNNDRDALKPYFIWHMIIPIKSVIDLTI